STKIRNASVHARARVAAEETNGGIKSRGPTGDNAKPVRFKAWRCARGTGHHYIQSTHGSLRFSEDARRPGWQMPGQIGIRVRRRYRVCTFRAVRHPPGEPDRDDSR